jgi:NifU-like protein involved in Fe-S cluster formation
VTTEDLYQDELVRLARAATGAGGLDRADGAATLDNPLCGDRVTFEVRLEGGRIAAVAHRVRGCLLCEASASLLGEAAPGATAPGVDAARAAVTAMLAEGAPPPEDARWRRLALFEPVREVRSRHRCVILPFEALGEALARARRSP